MNVETGREWIKMIIIQIGSLLDGPDVGALEAEEGMIDPERRNQLLNRRGILNWVLVCEKKGEL